MVRPVELQDLFSKTQAAERVTELQKAHTENQQRQAASETAHRADDQQRKTVASTKSDEVILHRDHDEKDKKDKKKKLEDEGEDTQSQSQAEHDDGSQPEDAEPTAPQERPPSLDLTA